MIDLKLSGSRLCLYLQTVTALETMFNDLEFNCEGFLDILSLPPHYHLSSILTFYPLSGIFLLSYMCSLMLFIPKGKKRTPTTKQNPNPFPSHCYSISLHLLPSDTLYEVPQSSLPNCSFPAFPSLLCVDLNFSSGKPFPGDSFSLC